MPQAAPSITVERTPADLDPSIGYRTQSKESTEVELGVTGELPAWLGGTLLRNGPALFEDAERTVRHWFDGQAMVHRFTVNAGAVTYANRFLRTKQFKAMSEDGKLAYGEFATDPCRSIFKRAMTLFDPQVTDNAVISVARLGDRYLAMTEGPMSVEFDPRTLETLGYGPKVPGTFATAHPHRDPATGTLVNVASLYGPVNSYRFFTQAPGDKPGRIVSERVGRPGYVHSFAMSDRYLALTEFPLTVNPLEILATGRPFIENFKWEPERGTRILVWDRRTGEKAGEFETESGFAFHHVGAWEEGETLTMEYVDHGTPEIIEDLYLDQVRTHSAADRAHRLPPRLRRVSIDLASGGVESQIRSEQGIELPRINEDDHYLGRYRWVYGVGALMESDYNAPDQLVKLDNETGDADVWSEDGCFPGEPVYVSPPDSQAEDAGVALSVVLDARRERSFLLALDAQSWTEVARAWAPHEIPYGIHGAFFEA
jgi:carotenoid cleavage dioxygenase-like enzyme